MKTVLSSVYAGNLMYYSVLAKSSQVYIDGFENFHKQSYRNRCVISSPNGPLKLIIPIIRISKNIVTVEAHIEHVPESAFSVILDKIEK